MSGHTIRRCPYHSYEHATVDDYQPAERAILSAAMEHVPELGFTEAAIHKGALDTGHLEITRNLFPSGAFDLVRFHLYRERYKLQDLAPRLTEAQGTGRKIRLLCYERLLANRPYIRHWQDALSLMALPSNVPASLKELHNLSDEMWHLVDDQSSDMAWYTKRMSLSTVYASTDMFMTQDRSDNHKDTWEFLDRRLKEVHTVGSSVSEISQFVGFQLWQAGNILASKGIKI